MKGLLRRCLRRFDLDVVRTHTTIEGHLPRLWKALDINVMLDVGAHFGEYASEAREMGYRGRIVSFEPVPDSYARLERTMRGDPGWLGMNTALGSTGGTMPINVALTSDQTSFLTPTPTEWFGDRTDHTETVKIDRLDNLIGECMKGIDSPRIYLKIDTQGFDREVVRGATKTLPFVLGMQTEIAVHSMYEGVPTFPGNARFFLDLGFEPTGIFAVARDPRDMIQALEYDLVMRRAR